MLSCLLIKAVMKERIRILEESIDNSNKYVKHLNQSILDSHSDLNSEILSTKTITIEKSHDEPIAILVIACNRPNAVESHLKQLIDRRAKINKINKFPIIVSQDCNHKETAQTVEKYKDSLFAFLKVCSCLFLFLI